MAAAIVLIGIGAAWWFQQTHQAPQPHPETVLFRGIEEPRAVLAEAFRSYDSEAAVATALEAAGLSVQRKVLERPFNPRHPPRRIASFTINGYKHLDCEGVLVLEFFNDRLMEADFRPDDPGRYAPRLHRAVPDLQRGRTGHAEWVAPPLRLWSTVDLAKSKVGRTLGSDGVVLWQDLRLIAQRDDWDARFGHIPVPAPK
ncbi:MAG: hypothetical protein V4709_06230 [Pseudomonadota bacterium]